MYLTYTWQDYLTYSPSSYDVVHLLLTIPGSCDYDPVIPVLLSQGVIECVTGMISRVTIRDSIQDSIILDILPSSFHKLPEFSFRNSLRVFVMFSLGAIFCHSIHRIFFAPNTLNVHIFVF